MGCDGTWSSRPCCRRRSTCNCRSSTSVFHSIPSGKLPAPIRSQRCFVVNSPSFSAVLRLFVFVLVAMPDLTSCAPMTSVPRPPSASLRHRSRNDGAGGLFDDVIKPEVVGEGRDATWSTVRYHKLYSVCSQHHVRLTAGRTDAQGAFDDPYTNLQTESVGFRSQVRIQSARHHGYLCFNRRGRLSIKMTGGQRKPTDDRCIFHERHSPEGYTLYQSIHNDSWYMAFNRKGAPVEGSSWKLRPASLKCRQFVKTDFAYVDASGSGTEGGGRGTDFRPFVQSPSRPPHRKTASNGPASVDFRRIFAKLRTSTTTTTITTTQTPLSSSSSDSNHRRRHQRKQQQRRQRQQQQREDRQSTEQPPTT